MKTHWGNMCIVIGGRWADGPRNIIFQTAIIYNEQSGGYIFKGIKFLATSSTNDLAHAHFFHGPLINF